MAEAIKQIVPPAQNGYHYKDSVPVEQLESHLKALYKEAILSGFNGSYIQWLKSRYR